MKLNETSRSSEVRPSIYGSETEFGYHLISDKDMDLDDLLGEASKLSTKDTYRLNECLGVVGQETEFGLTPNGGRIYQDWGAQLEVATPECKGIYELVKYELAAEDLARQSLEKFVDGGFIDGFQLHKRSHDHGDNFWGAHENYSNVDMVNVHEEVYLRLLGLNAVHQVARTIYTGEGGFSLSPTTHKLSYSISPRTNASTTIYSDNRTIHPLVHAELRHDMNAPERLQNCSAASVSPWAIAVKNGMNSVLMKLAIKAEASKETELALADLREASYAANHEYKPHKTILVEEGGRRLVKVRPTEIETALAEAALEKLELSDDEKWTCQQVIEVCDDLDLSPDLAANRVDWLARQKYLEGHGLDPERPVDRSSLKERRILDLDFCWDLICMTDETRNIKGIRGQGIKDRAKGWGWHNIEQLTRKDISRACTTPPATRAAERMALASVGHQIKDWDDYEFDDPYGNNTTPDELELFGVKQ